MLLAAVAFALAFYARNRNKLNDFLPPSTLACHQLEYEWEPYAEIIVFSADMDLADIDRWYVDNFEIERRDESKYAPGQLTIYFSTDAQGRSVSVCLADTSVLDAADNLSAYVYSEHFEEIIDSNPRLIGVLFMEDLNETVRKLEAAGEL